MTEKTGRGTVMLLGAGERIRELALAFEHLGVEVARVDDYGDPHALSALIDRVKPRHLVADAADVAAETLIAIAERGDVEVFPTPRSTRLGQDAEGLRRLAADELGLPTAPFWFAGSVDELTAVAAHAGFPLVVKPVAAAAPGEGESVMLRPEDVEPAWRRAAAGTSSGQRVIAETVV